MSKQFFGLEAVEVSPETVKALAAFVWLNGGRTAMPKGSEQFTASPFQEARQV